MRFFLKAMLFIGLGLVSLPFISTAANGDTTGAGIALTTPENAPSLSAAITGAAGSSEERLSDVVLVGPGSVGALTMTVERTRTSALDQGPLRYSVERCDTAWVATSTTYTCPTAVRVLRASAPLGPRADVTELGGVEAGAVAHLKVRFDVAADAPSNIRGQYSTLEFRITASL